jgi:hypothetical protein
MKKNNSCLECRKKIWDYLARIEMLFPILVLFILGEIGLDYENWSLDFYKNAAGYGSIFSYFLIIIGLCVARDQLTNMTKVNKSKFLLSIDDRWGQEETVRARTIIHRFYIQYKNKSNIVEQCKEIGNRIKYLSVSTSKNDQEEFIIILNFLDFLETVGYFTNRKMLDFEDVDSLCGESIEFFFKCFNPYIIHKRNKHNNQKFYIYFEELYNKRLEGNIKCV